jgi:histidyl-tRNA synthetase
VSGVGISFGLDRIYDVLEELKLFPDGLNQTSTQLLICAFDETTQLAALNPLRLFREAGIATELYPDLPQSKKEKEKPMLKPMNYADTLKIPYTLICKESGKMILKNMSEKTEQETTVEQVIQFLKSH